MGVNIFIAKRLSSDGRSGKRLSAISNTIAWISIAISILVIFIALAVLSGFKKEINHKISGFSGDIHLNKVGVDYRSDASPISKNISYLSKIDSLESVDRISPVSYRSGIIKTDENIQGLLFKGVDSTYNFDFFESALVEGTLPDFSHRTSNKILISKRMAQMMNYKVGDEVVAYYVGDNVKIRKYEVCGLYDIQFENIDKTLAIVDSRHIRNLNGWDKDDVSSFEITLAKGADLFFTTEEIFNIIYEYQSEEDPHILPTTIEREYQTLFDWLNLLDFNVAIIIILMIAVAGFNMISSLLIILFEKISMIGLLKSMGMTTKNICGVFLYRSMYIVGKGILWGNVVALICYFVQKYTHLIKLSPENYFVDFVPMDISLWTVLLLNIFSVLVIMLILSLSSIFVARVSPSKAMSVN